ncbi:MAG: alpha/beta fold hydrolase [Alphaproteobacteria bacterium]
MTDTKPSFTLEERFTEPEGFRWHQFKRDNRTLRFGAVSPKHSIPDAVVVCLPGLSEYGEKYYELARNMLDKNMAFWVIDWMGQGGSGRYLPNTFKRHSAGFDEDIEDLHYFITEYIKHSSVHPDKGRIPMAMIAHSMGGNVGLRYLEKYPNIFECAAFSAPMLGIKNLEKFPLNVLIALTEIMNAVSGIQYAPGQKDWSKNDRPKVGNDEFSGDPLRGEIHQYWQRENPALRIGGVTNKWLYDALRSCRDVHKAISNIQQDMIVGIAQKDIIVSNAAIRNAFRASHNAKLHEYPDAQHELLMERDSIRAPFLDAFYELVDRTILQKPETLKPF